MAIQTAGKSRSAKSSWAGVKELQEKLVNLVDATASAEAVALSAELAKSLEGRIVSNARSVGVPHEVYQDVFTYSRQRQKSPRIASLVGIRKRGRSEDAKAYVTWRARTSRFKFKLGRSAGRVTLKLGEKIAAGKKLGENLATMWELGTSIMAPRPFFRPAVNDSKQSIITALINGYKDIIIRRAKA